MESSWKMKDYGTKMRKEYKSGSSLITLSQHYNVPPVAIFRMILNDRIRKNSFFDFYKEKELKYAVKLGLRCEGDVYELLFDERDKEELNMAKVGWYDAP